MQRFTFLGVIASVVAIVAGVYMITSSSAKYSTRPCSMC